jgi:hypothetical protein
MTTKPAPPLTAEQREFHWTVLQCAKIHTGHVTADMGRDSAGTYHASGMRERAREVEHGQ